MLGRNPPLPEWAERFAVTRFTLSGRRTGEWFDGHNQSRLRDEHVRPGSFGLIAHPAAGFTGQPAAPYERDPHQWPSLSWYDRKSGDRIRIASASNLRGEAAELLATGITPVQTIGEVIHRYRLRPEHKSLDPDGQQARRDSRGQLGRRPVHSTLVLQQLVGKEGNKLLERQTGELSDSEEYRVDYGARGETWPIVVAAVRQLGAAAVARRSGLHRRTIERALRRSGDATTPHRANRARIRAGAAAEAEARLRQAGVSPPHGEMALLTGFLALVEDY